MRFTRVGSRDRASQARTTAGPHAILGRVTATAAVASTLAFLAPSPTGRALLARTSAFQALPSPSVPRVTVSIEALATARAGATGVPRVEAHRTVAVGDHIASATIVAGLRSGTDPCDVAVVPSSEAADAYVSWRVDGVVQAADDTSVTLSLGWQRAVRDPATGIAVVAMADQRTVRLQPTDEHVLDFVQPAGETMSPCANAVLRVRAARATPPAIARKWLTVDLWLTYEPSAGEHAATRRLQVAGPEGDIVAFAFAPFRWDLDGTQAATPSARTVSVAVNGTVRGACHPDGGVDVELVARRSVALDARGGFGSGRKVFALVPGETVAVEVPNPTMTVVAPMPEQAPRGLPWAPGVQLSADSLSVDLREFFRGSRLLLMMSGRCG